MDEWDNEEEFELRWLPVYNAEGRIMTNGNNIVLQHSHSKFLLEKNHEMLYSCLTF